MPQVGLGAEADASGHGELAMHDDIDGAIAVDADLFDLGIVEWPLELGHAD